MYLCGAVHSPVWRITASRHRASRSSQRPAQVTTCCAGDDDENRPRNEVTTTRGDDQNAVVVVGGGCETGRSRLNWTASAAAAAAARYAPRANYHTLPAARTREHTSELTAC